MSQQLLIPLLLSLNSALSRKLFQLFDSISSDQNHGERTSSPFSHPTNSQPLTMKTKAAVAILFFSLFISSQARITSFGNLTSGTSRAMLKDSDYVVNPSDGNILNNSNFQVEIANVVNFPVLGLVDVQAQIVRVTLNPGAEFVPHYHPRGTEILNALKGVFEITITEEGLSPRKIKNIVKAGESIPFPQGLIHETKCNSTGECLFLSVFNTADPGLVPVAV